MSRGILEKVSWKGNEHSPDVLDITIEDDNVGTELNVILMSDEHYDSIYCDREKLKEHLDMALENNWLILNFGDFFDVMGGKYDPRSHKGEIRKEYNYEDYFDRVKNCSCDFLTPYAKNIAMIAKGNHEHEVLRRREFSLTDGLITRLNHKTDSNIFYGGYDGWVRFLFKSPKQGVRYTHIMRFTHGSGGANKKTLGMLQHSDRAVNYSFDSHVSGHIHTGYYTRRKRVHLSARGKERDTEMHFIQLGSYQKSDSYYSKKSEHSSTCLSSALFNFNIRKRLSDYPPSTTCTLL